MENTVKPSKTPGSVLIWFWPLLIRRIVVLMLPCVLIPAVIHERHVVSLNIELVKSLAELHVPDWGAENVSVADKAEHRRFDRLPCNYKQSQNYSPTANAVRPCEVSGPYWRLTGILCIVAGLAIVAFSDRSRLSLSCALFAMLLGLFCIMGHTDDCGDSEGNQQKRENFTAAVGLHFAYYNFAKRHNTLRCTPAMAAGVAKTFWSVGDLLEAAA